LFYNDGDIKDYIPIIFLFLLALYRLLPAVNKILGGINNIQYLMPILSDVMHDIKLETEQYSNNKIEFKESINIQNLSFSYRDKIIFDNINLNIQKNDKVALIGPSGVGKSTLINILLGFIDNYKSDIYIDSTKLSKGNWLNFRKKIGYIPQDVYLFDSTVADNIVFGRDYNEKKIIEALQKANIYDDLKEKEGLNTRVGDGGIQLSGGQKQRIAIARALYSDPEIIIMDEGTSALDVEVEKKIMNEIFNISKNKTLIIITHRIDSIKDCNKIYKLENKKIEEVK
jgi:ABC-type multidrug transport system fused ATPase/permease subunit